MSGVLFLAEEKLTHLENPQLEAEVLLSALLEVGRPFLRLNPDKKLSWRKYFQFTCWLKMRAQNMPVAYICGWQEWRDFRIVVSPAVLIPRDETEILVEKIFERENNPRTILDVGTGSGCIALSMAKQFPNAVVTAVDYSLSALRVARKNFSAHHIEVRDMHSDLLSSVLQGEKFDVIIANLPYVPETIDVSLEVQKEPGEAIFSGSDGLDLLRRFARELDEKDIRFTALWLEFLPQEWEDIQKIFKKWQVEPHHDLEGYIYFARITS